MARPLTPEQEELRECVEELDRLEREVMAREAARPTQTKIIPFEFAQTFVFPYGDMKVQKATFKNGAEDLYFSQPSFVVSSLYDSATPPEAQKPLAPGEGGFQTAGAGAPVQVNFDFAWNYSIGSQGENYGSSANDTLWLSRKSLGNRERWLPLSFRYPLRLKGGDSITFTLKPSYFLAQGNLSSLAVAVNLTMTGVRNGRMAESAYDPEFRPAYRRDRK